MKNSQDNNRRMIQEAIRKIALGRSIERIEMAPGGMGGVGTARMIHGYVAKIHDDPSDEEFADYGGTVDVGEYPDETASAGGIIHKGVLLAAARNNEGGFLIVPTLFSEVTIVVDAATCHAYIVNYSHAETIRMEAHSEVSIGMTETETLDPDSDSSPDYDASAQEEPVTGGCLHEPPARSRQRGDAAAPAFRFRDRGGQGPRRLEDARQDGAHARTDGNPYPDGTRTRGAFDGRHRLNGVQHAGGLRNDGRGTFCRSHRIRYRSGETALVLAGDDRPRIRSGIVERNPGRTMKRRLLNKEDGSDPMSVVSNLFDVAMVFAVALMVALVSRYNMTEMFSKEDFTMVKNPGKEDMEIITKEGEKINRYTPSENQDPKSGKKGKKVGIAYELENGEIIYVPE